MVNELVQRLSEGKHEVVIGHRDELYEEIKKHIEGTTNLNYNAVRLIADIDLVFR